jgi:integrase
MPTPSAQPTQAITSDPAKLLSVVAVQVTEEKDLAVSSLKDYNVGVRRFIEVIGDKDVRTINRSDVSNFKAALRQIPRTGRPDVAQMIVQEQIEWADANDAKRISTTSVNKYLAALQSILVHAHDRTAIFDGVQGWVSPVKGFIDTAPKVKQDSEEDDDRRPFTPEELARLFDLKGDFEAGFVKDQTTRRWMIHIMCWTGLRLEEAAQLRTVDIRTTDKGVHYLVVTNRAEGQKVKREWSRRAVPLHPEMIALGFLDFVESIKQKHGEDAWLFHDLDHTDMKNRGRKISTAFLRWVRKQSFIADPERLGSHYLRHSFKTAGRGRIADVYLDAMCGHKPEDDATVTYIKQIRFDADRLWEEGLSKIPF